MISRVEYNEKLLYESDSMLMKSFFHVASISSMTPRLSNQLTGYIQFQKKGRYI